MTARSTSAWVRSAHGIAAVIGGKPDRYQSDGTSTTLPIARKVYIKTTQMASSATDDLAVFTRLRRIEEPLFLDRAARM